jgi:hypothetical protein
MQLAQAKTPLGTFGSGSQGELGPFAGKSITSPLATIVDYVSSIVGIMTIFASIWFLFNILYAGYEWISAGGDTKKVAGARDRITHAFMGLVIIAGAWSLLAIAGQFLGYNTLVSPDALKSLPTNFGQ